MKTLKLVFYFLFLTSLAFAQIPSTEPAEEEEASKEKPVLFEKPKAEWKSRLRYGGNVWLGFFGSIFVDVSPTIGYDLTGQNTVAGLSIPIIYQGAYQSSSSLTYGTRFFVRQKVLRSIFVHGEYQYINSDKRNFYQNFTGESTKAWAGNALLGAGFYQGRTRQQKGSFISVLYNLGAPNKGFIDPQSLFGANTPFVLRLGYLF
jgi:hypothetical protein